MLKSENVATPLTAVTLVVPDSVPPLGFVSIATATLPLKLVAVFACASWAVTRTAGVIAAPAGPVLACVEKTSAVAAPGVTVTGVEVVPVRPAALAERV